VAGVFWTVGAVVGVGSRLAWGMRSAQVPPQRLWAPAVRLHPL